jgi:hypothetical protein
MHMQKRCRQVSSTEENLFIQVHAVSCKASDVRPVVMKLNAERQALDEAEEQPVQPEAAGHEPTAEPEGDIGAWQDFTEAKHCCHNHCPACITKVHVLANEFRIQSSGCILQPYCRWMRLSKNSQVFGRLLRESAPLKAPMAPKRPQRTAAEISGVHCLSSTCNGTPMEVAARLSQRLSTCPSLDFPIPRCPLLLDLTEPAI